MGLTDETNLASQEEWNVLCQRGHTLRLAGAIGEAEGVYHDVLARCPGHIDAAASLAFMLREVGRLKGASAVILASWRERLKDPVESEKAAHFLRECEAWNEVLEVCAAQLALTPGVDRLLALAGDAALVLGRFALAGDYLREALVGNPNMARPWLRLSQTRSYKHDDPDLDRFRRAFCDTRLTEPVRTSAGFALGKALDDAGDYRGAAEAFTTANLMARRQSKWSTLSWEKFVESRRAAPALPTTRYDPGFVPVFVIGLPRSGTTLLARMLERYEQVRNRGELNWTDAFAQHLQDRRESDPTDLIERISRLFAAQLRRDDAPSQYYIDKNPLNFRHLDLIAAIFPGARVIHCRRNRHDVALSLWCQYFAHPDMGFAYDFGDISAFTNGYLQFMLHWESRNPLQVLDVDYERLVSAPDAEVRRVAAFLSLDAVRSESECVLPSNDVIATASVWQARQPIHTRSIGRWQHYKDFVPLEPTPFS